MKHAMTIDVEDYFHVSAFENVIDRNDWDNRPSRVERNTHILLDLFDEKEAKATFFVLGWVAERMGGLVREITSRGHEVASHGFSHKLIYRQTSDEFREETAKSKNILEELTQKKIEGYRAASYSITKKSLWALDILVELGFTWDSSIFPVYHDNYGITDSPRAPYILKTPSGGELREYPLTTSDVFGFPVPAAGGGYFRQYPYFLSKWLFKRAVNQTKCPGIFYLHPWEIDSEQPRIESASTFSRFRHYRNLDKCIERLGKILDDFEFTSLDDAMAGQCLNSAMEIS